MWRPPYGGVNRADEKTAQSLGLRVVLDSGTNIIDANDWEGLSAAQIAAGVNPVLRNGTIIKFHDGLRQAPQMIQALPRIVAYMNAHHLGATTDIRPNATGGVVPYLGPLPARSIPRRPAAPVRPPSRHREPARPRRPPALRPPGRQRRPAGPLPRWPALGPLRAGQHQALFRAG